MGLGEYNGCFEAGGGGVQGMFWRVVGGNLMGGICWGYGCWCTEKKLEKSARKWVEGEGID